MDEWKEPDAKRKSNGVFLPMKIRCHRRVPLDTSTSLHIPTLCSFSHPSCCEKYLDISYILPVFISLERLPSLEFLTQGYEMLATSHFRDVIVGSRSRHVVAEVFLVPTPDA